MPYTIDYTAGIHLRNKLLLVLGFVLSLAVLGVGVWRGLWLYDEMVERPTLESSLGTYQDLAEVIEGMHETWKGTVEDYNHILPYYRLYGYWTESVTNVFPALLGQRQKGGENLTPESWRIQTGGDVELTYSTRHLWPHDPAEIEDVRHSLHETFRRWDPGITNSSKELPDSGSEHLWTVRFQLCSSNVVSPPPVPQDLITACDSIRKQRERIQKHVLEIDGKKETVKEVMTDARERMLTRIPPDHKYLNDKWKKMADSVIDPATFFQTLNDDAKRLGIAPPPEVEALWERWNILAQQRWPWRRAKNLDNQALSNEVRELRELVEKEFFPLHWLQKQARRIADLRQSLYKGYKYDLVLFETSGNDGDPSRPEARETANFWLKSLLYDLKPFYQTEVAFSESSVKHRLMLASWSLSARPSEETDENSKGNGILTVAKALECIRKIPFSRHGFEIDSVYLEMTPCPEKGSAVSRLEARGVFSVVLPQNSE